MAPNPAVLAGCQPQTGREEPEMDKERYERGLKMRKEVMGEDYVSRVMENAGEFGKEFQEYVTEMAWGGAWGREDGLSKRERSILNLGMLAAMGKSQEFAGHFRGAMRNGLTLKDLNEVLLQISLYCGFPAGVESFRIAKQVLDEQPSS